MLLCIWEKKIFKFEQELKNLKQERENKNESYNIYVKQSINKIAFAFFL